MEGLSFRYDFDNGLSADAVWLKTTYIPASAPATLILNDSGKKGSGELASDRVNRGEQVLAADLLSFAPEKDSGMLVASFQGRHQPFMYAQMLSNVGERPLGMQVAQFISIAHWYKARSKALKIWLETIGIRSQVVALAAAALEPNLFSTAVEHDGMPSLRYLLDTPVEFQAAPELFCLDLYRNFDLDRLAEIAAPTQVSVAPTEVRP